MKRQSLTLLFIALSLSFLKGQAGGVEVLNGTFLGNVTRNYYGDRAPDRLDILWQLSLGTGKTVISRKEGSRSWSGAGWTGQPLIVKEGNDTFLIQGAYDHNLKKISASTGKIVWQYRYDDVIKGTGSLWVKSDNYGRPEDILILQGSRLGIGNYLDSPHVPSYRAISYFTGKEMWRLDVTWTDSYSRDVDGSALVIGDTAYIGLENSLFTVFSPDPAHAALRDSMLQPRIYLQRKLYFPRDVTQHKYNVVTESSPSKIGRMIYVTSGSGHVWGYEMDLKELTWDYPTGSDMDGSPVVAGDRYLLVPVEKQYIQGKGGILFLDPSKTPSEAAIWYCPVNDTAYASWQGGVIGSAAVTDHYNDRHLAAFTGVDGILRVVKYDELSGKKVYGPDGSTLFDEPVSVFTYKTGPSISTPLFTSNRLVVCGYDGIYLFAYDEENHFTLLDHFAAAVEATPVVAGGKLFIASRNGYLYCFGKKD
ncbi:MAG: PQQ-binding-like beta-propeller repeat protein [Bacteroidota bacterium]